MEKPWGSMPRQRTRLAGQTYPVQVHASRVVVAAGALNSPALLMRSGLRMPALGQNLFLHPTSAPVTATYDEPIEAWNGPPQTILSDEFANLVGNFNYRLGSFAGSSRVHWPGRSLDARPGSIGM